MKAKFKVGDTVTLTKLKNCSGVIKEVIEKQGLFYYAVDGHGVISESHLRLSRNLQAGFTQKDWQAIGDWEK